MVDHARYTELLDACFLYSLSMILEEEAEGERVSLREGHWQIRSRASPAGQSVDIVVGHHQLGFEQH